MIFSEKFFHYYEDDDVKLTDYNTNSINCMATYTIENKNFFIRCTYDHSGEQYYVYCLGDHTRNNEAGKMLEKLKDWRNNPYIRLKNLFSPLHIEIR